MYKAIIVDDEDLVREAIVALGKWVDFGFEKVYEATNAKAALEIIDRELPDLVITDMKMPVMDGVQLLKELENRQNHSKVLVISGFSDFEYTKQAIRSKVVDYILKPIDPQELNNALSAAINMIEEEKKAEPLNDEIIVDNPVNETIYEVEKYIREHFTQDIALDELSRKFYISKEHISRTFKKKFNTNLFEYINMLKIEKAKELIVKTQLSIEEIAEKVGFSNGNYFSKAFRKQMQLSPSEYRNMSSKK